MLLLVLWTLSGCNWSRWWWWCLNLHRTTSVTGQEGREAPTTRLTFHHMPHLMSGTGLDNGTHFQVAGTSWKKYSLIDNGRFGYCIWGETFSPIHPGKEHYYSFTWTTSHCSVKTVESQSVLSWAKLSKTSAKILAVEQKGVTNRTYFSSFSPLPLLRMKNMSDSHNLVNHSVWWVTVSQFYMCQGQECGTTKHCHMPL